MALAAPHLKYISWYGIGLHAASGAEDPYAKAADADHVEVCGPQLVAERPDGASTDGMLALTDDDDEDDDEDDDQDARDNDSYST